MNELSDKIWAVLRGNRQVSVAIILLCLAFAANAETPEEYSEQIQITNGRIAELLATVAKSELGPRDTAVEKDIVASIRKEMPATEKVTWPGGEIETDNKWLFEQLDAFENEQDSVKRAVILTAINERLTAIGEKVDEISNPVAGRSKDEDKQKLAEILRREEYQKAQAKEESLVQKWIREFWEWFARVFPREAPSALPQSDLSSFKLVLQVLIYAVVIALVGFLIFKFAPFFSRRFGRKDKREKGDRVILGERIGDDQSADDLFSEAERLAREGNLRAAIRKGYIAVLCELSDRKVIGLARHKTNRDYLRDVRKNGGLYENMTGLTRNFETNWYGLRTAEPADWEDFRVLYKQAILAAGGRSER
ncbi:hypothetical protein BH10ACI3_BH10ACI3_27770 [soil metagenome]